MPGPWRRSRRFSSRSAADPAGARARPQGPAPSLRAAVDSRGQVDTLFPRMASYLYTPYHYYGPEMFTMEEKLIRYYV